MEQKNGRNQLVPVLTEETIEENLGIILNLENYIIKKNSGNHKCVGVHEHTAHRKQFRGQIKEHVRNFCNEKKVPTTMS